MRHIITIFSVAAVALTASAQDLSKEITVDRTVMPEQREAQRPAFYADVLPVPTLDVSLEPAEYLLAGTITNRMSLLPAPAWKATSPMSPYRGYASIGYFPTFNLGVNAGYRFVNNNRASLGAWMQYDGCSYKYKEALENDRKVKSNFVTIGVDAALQVDDKSLLSADFSYGYSHQNHPLTKIDYNEYTQQVNRVLLDAAWQSQVGNMAYDVKGKVSTFAVGKGEPTVLDGVKDKLLSETLLGIEADGRLVQEGAGRAGWLGLRLAASSLLDNSSNDNRALYEINPYLNFDLNSLKVRLGANISVGTGEATKLRVSPDIALSYVPVDVPFSAYVKLGGGQRLMPASRFFALDPWLLPLLHNTANEVIIVDGGLNVGCVGGVSLKVYGKYARVEDWGAPSATFTNYGSNFDYLYSNVNSWIAGAKMAYEYGTLLSATAGVEVAGSNNDAVSWYEWLDRAKTVVSASLSLRPIDKLEAGLSYGIRMKRAMSSVNVGNINTASQTINLKDASSLDLSVSYAFTPQITAFAKVENILGETWLGPSLIQSQGMHGLIGAAVKF